MLLNTRDFYAPLVEMLDRSITERFMRPEHAQMWTAVDTVDEVLPAIENAPPWGEAAREIATW